MTHISGKPSLNSGHIPDNGSDGAQQKYGDKKFDGRHVYSVVRPRNIMVNVGKKGKTLTIKPKLLKERKVAKLDKTITDSVKKENSKAGAVKRFFKKCAAGIAGVAVGVSTFIAGAVGGAVAGGVFGGAVLGLLTGGLLTPVGLLVGGIVGAALGAAGGVGVGAMLGKDAAESVFSGLDKRKGMPHTKPWMRKALGDDAIKRMLKEKPTAMDIREIEKALAKAPENMQRLLNSPECRNSAKKRAYYQDRFAKFDEVAQTYLQKARERAFPGGKVLINEWLKTSETDMKKADKELGNVVDFLVKSAKECEDRNSMAALRYIRDEISDLDEDKDSKKLKKIVKQIDKCLDKLDAIEPSKWEKMSPEAVEAEAQKYSGYPGREPSGKFPKPPAYTDSPPPAYNSRGANNPPDYI